MEESLFDKKMKNIDQNFKKRMNQQINIQGKQKIKKFIKDINKLMRNYRFNNLTKEERVQFFELLFKYMETYQYSSKDSYSSFKSKLDRIIQKMEYLILNIAQQEIYNNLHQYMKKKRRYKNEKDI